MEYQGFIFTKHALERLNDRSVSQELVIKTLQNPDSTQPTEKPGNVKFIRNLHNRNVQVIATYLENQKKWLIVSVWVRGEEDKVPLMWQLIILPFKLLWFLIKKLSHYLINR